MTERQLALITELRHTLHAHPELSLREHETRARLRAFLETHTTLTVEEGERYLCACYRAAKPKAAPIAFRADMDALPMEEGIDLPYGSQNPGAAHKCGHDGHSAGLCGFALLLEERGADRDVYLIFQCAEEIGAGGKACAELLRERGVCEVYACHNWQGIPKGAVGLISGTVHCASQGMTLSFEGTPAHASTPEDGKNPARALSELVLSLERIVSELREASGGLVLATVVGMEAGGRNFGMSAYSGALSLTIRAQYQKDLAALRAAVLRKAGELAEAGGLTLTAEECDIFPETRNHEANVQKVAACAARLGLSTYVLPEPIRSSEDFGYYTEVCPGALFFLGNGEDYPPIHTHGFDFPDRHLAPVGELFYALCRAEA